MGMSEFDRQPNSEGDDFSFLSTQRPVIPADFDEEDLAFADELNCLFSPEEEELPPYFVQTLLESEDARFYAVEPGFERKTSAHVFRDLKLRRRLFYEPRSIPGVVMDGVSGIYARGSLLVVAAAFMLIMLVTVAFTGPSFAQGMVILLHGGRGGVLQVSQYPKVVHKFSPNDVNDQPAQLSLLAAQQQLHFKIYWPQSLPKNYSLDTIYLFNAEHWADGPIVDLVYDFDAPGVAPKGLGQLVIREFKASEDVLQVVQDGAAHSIQVDQDGRPEAIYVDGQWTPRVKYLSPHWISGTRSELIYQLDGVVFWIAGDQRDGIGETDLWNIAKSLQTIPFNRAMLMAGETIDITQTRLGDVRDIFWTDLLVVGGSDNAYFINYSSYQSQNPVVKAGSNAH